MNKLAATVRMMCDRFTGEPKPLHFPRLPQPPDGYHHNRHRLFIQQQCTSLGQPFTSKPTLAPPCVETDLRTVTAALGSDMQLHAWRERLDLHLISIPVRCLEWDGRGGERESEKANCLLGR